MQDRKKSYPMGIIQKKKYNEKSGKTKNSDATFYKTWSLYM